MLPMSWDGDCRFVASCLDTRAAISWLGRTLWEMGVGFKVEDEDDGGGARGSDWDFSVRVMGSLVNGLVETVGVGLSDVCGGGSGTVAWSGAENGAAVELIRGLADLLLV